MKDDNKLLRQIKYFYTPTVLLFRTTLTFHEHRFSPTAITKRLAHVHPQPLLSLNSALSEKKSNKKHNNYYYYYKHLSLSVQALPCTPVVVRRCSTNLSAAISKHLVGSLTA